MTKIIQVKLCRSCYTELPSDIFVPIKQKLPTMESPQNEKKFFPKGAIAFFVALVLLSLLFWYGIYFLMIERT